MGYFGLYQSRRSLNILETWGFYFPGSNGWVSSIMNRHYLMSIKMYRKAADIMHEDI